MSTDSTVPLTVFSSDLALARHEGSREATVVEMRKVLEETPAKLEALFGDGSITGVLLRAAALREELGAVGGVAAVASLGAFEVTAQSGVPELVTRELRRVEASWVSLAPHLERFVARTA